MEFGHLEGVFSNRILRGLTNRVNRSGDKAENKTPSSGGCTLEGRRLTSHVTSHPLKVLEPPGNHREVP